MRLNCIQIQPEKWQLFQSDMQTQIIIRSMKLAKTSSVSQLHESFDAAPATFRLAAAVAEFAEILRESYWAKDGSLDSVHQVVKNAFREIDSEDVVELMYLVNKAISHKAEQS